MPLQRFRNSVTSDILWQTVHRGDFAPCAQFAAILYDDYDVPERYVMPIAYTAPAADESIRHHEGWQVGL